MTEITGGTKPAGSIGRKFATTFILCRSIETVQSGPRFCLGNAFSRNRVVPITASIGDPLGFHPNGRAFWTLDGLPQRCIPPRGEWARGPMRHPVKR
ncbi:hypothetical protein K227x_23140 [Rubripirellula lacrimiformis]|uniref:Uncharacterized protein n=1 Tax=Rubripirellula lacrimiformis TaxID=1930273 RepID=A0A517N9W4_9BACT|nr:hypothetical protein K227x_23140 [Rubripirellula lacrimiformis]